MSLTSIIIRISRRFYKNNFNIGENSPEYKLDSEQPSVTQLKISQICAQYSGPGYHVEDSIPDKKLKTAKECFPIPSAEKVIALVDGTVLGTAKNGLIIGRKGIYWNNWQVPTQKTSLTWEQFSRVKIQRQGKFEIQLGEGNIFDMAGAAFDKYEMCKLLRNIQEILLSEEKEVADR